jgi:hypothetical protein
MNGSLFAQLLSLSQWSRLVTSTTHNPLRKLGFCLLFAYQCLSLLLSFLLLGNMYFAYAILFRVLGMSMAEASQSGDGYGAAVAVRSAFSGLVSASGRLIRCNGAPALDRLNNAPPVLTQHAQRNTLRSVKSDAAAS